MEYARTALPKRLPEPWAYPARKRQHGWWTLRFGETERPLHMCQFFVTWGEREWNCHWCGQDLGMWHVEVDLGRRVHIDHVDGDKDNCHPSNLVASCRGCNWRKGRDWWGIGYFDPALYRVPTRVIEWESDDDALARLLTP